MITIIGSVIAIAVLALLVWAWYVEATPDLDWQWRDEPAWVACPTISRWPETQGEHEARAWAVRAGMRLGSAPSTATLDARRIAAYRAGLSVDARRWLASQWYTSGREG